MEERSGEKFRGDLPGLSARGNGIAEAWENSVVELYNNGGWYSREGPKDKGQMHVDATMTITIDNPDSPRFLHKYVRFNFPDLLEYEMELLGAKNSLTFDPKLDPEGDTRWPYQYSHRILKYPGIDGGTIDQLEGMIDGLSERPYARRNNIITWVPEKDIGADDPPCLQGIWAYIAPVGDGTFKLNMNYTFRSRNVMQASPMNMKGMHVLQSHIRDRVIENTGMPLQNGRMMDHSFSYHVSAQDRPILEGFMRRLGKAFREETDLDETTIDGRSYPEEFINQKYEEARPEVERKVIQTVRNRFEERYGLNDEIARIKQISTSRKREVKDDSKKD